MKESKESKESIWSAPKPVKTLKRVSAASFLRRRREVVEMLTTPPALNGSSPQVPSSGASASSTNLADFVENFKRVTANVNAEARRELVTFFNFVADAMASDAEDVLREEVSRLRERDERKTEEVSRKVVELSRKDVQIERLTHELANSLCKYELLLKGTVSQSVKEAVATIKGWLEE